MTFLDLPDIQGNLQRPYGRFGFPHARHFFFHVTEPVAGRHFVEALRPRVTTAEPWDTTQDADGKLIVAKPTITLNVGFTHAGLTALDLPTRTLRLFPDEFIDGMRCRADILGDVGASDPDRWDRAWRDGAPAAHVWVMLNVAANPDGTPLAVLGDWTDWLVGLAGEHVALLAGHGADGQGRWQESAALTEPLPGGGVTPIPREHFGFTDGIGDPVFRGQLDNPDAERIAVVGEGKLDGKDWSALEAGEFILGQVDEQQELPVASMPAEFVRNGTFMAWRKLGQDTAAFAAEVDRLAALWRRLNPAAGDDEARETVRAKIVGRWSTGIPLAAAPSWTAHEAMRAEHDACIALALKKPRDLAPPEAERLKAYNLMLTGFRYGDDLAGAKCPLGAHIRRANPRDMLDPAVSATAGSSTLVNRRRILRRGLPFVDPDGSKGIVFMAHCASLFRQFEFVQQQWMNYGLDFEAGNDGCPLIGARGAPTKHVIPAGPAGANAMIAADLPVFVHTRGGDYFFLPGIDALRMIAMGTVDPT